jgi:hypothetical protein
MYLPEKYVHDTSVQSKNILKGSRKSFSAKKPKKSSIIYPSSIVHHTLVQTKKNLKRKPEKLLGKKN